MKEKYVEERFPKWMLMGYYGSIEPYDENLTNCNDEMNHRVTPIVGQDLVRRQNELIDFIAKMADAFDKSAPEAFKQFWYKDSYEQV